MSRYVPNTQKQQAEMLSEMGMGSIEELLAVIPPEVRFQGELDLPKALSELELTAHLRALAAKNKNTEEYPCFLGAGAYDHYIPAVIGHLLSRQEFYTAYTPYQAEISQGTLQAIFEYQTMICELTGMDVANASMYDGPTAAAEAALMAVRSVGRPEILVSEALHPEYRQALKTYGRFAGFDLQKIGSDNGRLNLADLEAKISGKTAAVIVQNPNFFGVIESLAPLGELVKKHQAFFIVSADPLSLGILKPPGEAGADIVVGEGQALGTPLSFGGPYLGFFAAKKELMRQIPGRIVGETTDRMGRRGFVLALQTREQHIRREKATSNICSNQSLNALAATIYLTVMGKQGLREVAELCLQKARYAQERLVATGRFTPAFTAPFFKEFMVKSRSPVSEVNRHLLTEGIIGGYEVGRDYPEYKDGWLVAVTEKRTKEEIDRLAEKAGEVR